MHAHTHSVQLFHVQSHLDVICVRLLRMLTNKHGMHQANMACRWHVGPNGSRHRQLRVPGRPCAPLCRAGSTARLSLCTCCPCRSALWRAADFEALCKSELLHRLALCLVSCHTWLFSCNSLSSLGCTQDARRHCQLAVYLAERYVSEDTWRPCHALLCSPVRGTAACW